MKLLVAFVSAGTCNSMARVDRNLLEPGVRVYYRKGNSICHSRIALLRVKPGCHVLNMKVRPWGSPLRAREWHSNCTTRKKFCASRYDENPDGRIRYNYRQLELDSVKSVSGVSRVTQGFSGIEPEDSMLE